MERRAEILDQATALAGFPSQIVPGEPAKETPEVLQRADTIASGSIFFYGITPVEIGSKNIDWAGGQIEHQEWRAQLNRFHYLTPLARAYGKTGEEKYARAARDYINDWIDFNADYIAQDELHPGDNTLNMCIRLGSSVQPGWGGTLPVFLDSPEFNDEFLEKMLRAIARQADFLKRRLSPRGNWRIAHLDGLVFTCLRFPFMENSREILSAGIKGMRNALATQFLPDGVHIERTPGYAAWMTRVAANYLRLARIFPEADTKVDRGRFFKALDYMAHNRLFGVNDFTAPHRDPETDPLEQRSGLLDLTGMKEQAKDEPPLEQVFPDAGQVYMRSGWEPGADYLAFDASTWGGGHCHLSRLGFTFRSGGRMLIADPGILNYEMSDPFAPYGKSTRAHSTLNVDGLNQSEADASLHRVELTRDISFAHASYQGAYWPGRFEWRFVEGRGAGVYGRHERILLWVKGEYVLVLDLMEAVEGDKIHNCWQMGPMDGWEMKGATWWSRNEDTNLLLSLLVPFEGVEADCVEGSDDPIRGWLGVHGNDHVPAPHVEFRYEPSHPWKVSVVLACAFKGGEPPKYRAGSFREGHHGHLQHLEMVRPDGGRDLVSWSRSLEPPVDDEEPFRTDAPFVWLRLDGAGGPRKGFLVGGSYLEYGGQSLYNVQGRRALSFDL